MTDFAKNINLRGNKIKNAKVEILDRDAIADDDLIDKEYVDTVDKYSTDLTANASLQPSNEIFDRTKLHNMKTSEIFDELFYPNILVDYIKPTAELDVQYFEPFDPIDPVQVQTKPCIGGQLVDVQLTVNIELNSSASILSYDFTGPGIVGVVSQASNVFTVVGYIADYSQTWEVKVNYDQATPQNDSRGNIDLVGNNNSYFLADTLTITKEESFDTPYYGGSIIGDVPFPTASTFNTLFLSRMIPGPVPSTFDLAVDANATFTTFIAFESDDIPRIDVSKENSASVREAFTAKVIYNVPVGSQFKNFVVYRATNGIGFSSHTIYNVKRR